MPRRNGKTTRMIDQVIAWCLEGVVIPDGEACPTVAVMCADTTHVKDLQTQFINRAQKVGMKAEMSHLDEVHLWAGLRGKRCSVAFKIPDQTRGFHALSGCVRVFADHFAVQSELARALEPFGSAFSGVDPYQTVLRAVTELVPEQYLENGPVPVVEDVSIDPPGVREVRFKITPPLAEQVDAMSEITDGANDAIMFNRGFSVLRIVLEAIHEGKRVEIIDPENENNNRVLIPPFDVKRKRK